MQHIEKAYTKITFETLNNIIQSVSLNIMLMINMTRKKFYIKQNYI